MLIFNERKNNDNVSETTSYRFSQKDQMEDKLTTVKVGTKFTLKIILLSTLPVIFFFIFSSTMLLYKVNNLSSSAAERTGEKFNEIYTQILKDKSRDNAEKVRLKISTVLDELNILRASAQQLIDNKKKHPEEWQPNSWGENNFIYNSEKNWSILAESKSNISISVWGYLHNRDGSIHQKTKDYIDLMAPIKMPMQIIGDNGTDKGWFYVVGPKETPIMIMTPWAPMTEIFDKQYPGHNTKNWWDFFFPGIIEAWDKWPKNSSIINAGARNQVTLTPLYEDAGGTGLMVTFFAPLWNDKRTENYGAAAVDYNINNITNIVNDEKIGETGFVLLVQSNGNILGTSDSIVDRLELSQNIDGEKGVKITQTNLRESRISSLAKIAEQIDKVDEFTLYQFVDSKGTDYLLAIQKLQNYNLWTGNGPEIIKDSLYIAAIVPKVEVFQAKYFIQGEIEKLLQDTLSFFIIASMLLAFLSIAFGGLFALQNTRQIREMLKAMKKVREQNYDVSVTVVAKDDLGELARAFNNMISEIRFVYDKLEMHTRDLEHKVKERTIYLEEANKKLNELSQVDGLTQINNRRYFDIRLDEIWREYARLNHPISIIMIDIDFFKKYNDSYGHQAGDGCLCAIASIIKNQVTRSSDVVARYGGEEFVVIACVDSDAAFKLAEKIRLAVEGLAIEHKSSMKGIISISLGIASAIPTNNNSISELINRADQALYSSKENGRDTISISENK
jgi:phosphoserine phosphatase RsbU/P